MAVLGCAKWLSFQKQESQWVQNQSLHGQKLKEGPLQAPRAGGGALIDTSLLSCFPALMAAWTEQLETFSIACCSGSHDTFLIKKKRDISCQKDFQSNLDSVFESYSQGLIFLSIINSPSQKKKKKQHSTKFIILGVSPWHSGLRIQQQRLGLLQRHGFDPWPSTVG